MVDLHVPANPVVGQEVAMCPGMHGTVVPGLLKMERPLVAAENAQQ